MTTATFSDALASAATLRPDKLALVDGGRRLTYRQLDALATTVAGALAEAGAGPGAVVTSRLPNCIEAVALCLAVCRLGAVHNPVVATHSDHEFQATTKDAKSAVVVDGLDPAVFQRPAPGARLPARADPDAPRFLLFTSGSTARPKGAQHSDATLLTEVSAQARFHQLTAAEVFICPSAVAHISGLLYGLLLPVMLGATTVLMDRWEPGEFLALVEAEGATFCGGAPVFLQGATDHPDVARRDLSSLAVFPVGGTDVAPDLVRRAARILGVRTGRGYGSTEFPSITSSAGPDTPDERRATTDGRAIGANQVRLSDDGEIEARGPELFLGYTDTALDAEAFTADGWFRTGDLGVLDGDGYLTVTGRRKDIIIRHGVNISAAELEQLIGAHGGVGAVAVVAVPDVRTGERACACVVATDPTNPPTLAELNAFLDGQGLSRRKFPEELVVLDALPVTAAGKTDKQALRAQLGPDAH